MIPTEIPSICVMERFYVKMDPVEPQSLSVLRSVVPSSHPFDVPMDSVSLMKSSVLQFSCVVTPSSSVVMVPV